MQKKIYLIVSKSGRLVSYGETANEAWRRLAGFMSSARAARERFKPYGYSLVTGFYKVTNSEKG